MTDRKLHDKKYREKNRAKLREYAREYMRRKKVLDYLKKVGL